MSDFKECVPGNCKSEILEYLVPAFDGSNGWDKLNICEQHAAEMGFCLVCGWHYGGDKKSELDAPHGLCYNCYQDLLKYVHILEECPF